MNRSPTSFVAAHEIAAYVHCILLQRYGIRRALLAALVAAWCGCASVPPTVDVVVPTIAYPFDRETLMRDDIAACSETINSLAWEGMARWEAAAFLRLDDDGHFSCDLWPIERRSQTAHWRGLIPPGTTAIIHSHSRHDPKPSMQDAYEACRIGIPVIVATPDSISMALPCRTAVVQAVIMRHVHTAAHVR